MENRGLRLLSGVDSVRYFLLQPKRQTFEDLCKLYDYPGGSLRPGHSLQPVALDLTQLSTSQSVHAGHRLDPSCQISGSVGAIPEAVPGMVSGGIPLNGSELIPRNADLVIVIHIMPVTTGDTPFLCVRFAD